MYVRSIRERRKKPKTMGRDEAKWRALRICTLKSLVSAGVGRQKRRVMLELQKTLKSARGFMLCAHIYAMNKVNWRCMSAQL